MSKDTEGNEPDTYELIEQLRQAGSQVVGEMFELNTKAVGVIRAQAQDFLSLASFFEQQAARCRGVADAAAELATLTAVATGDIINAEFLIRAQNSQMFSQMLADEQEAEECDDDDE